ncbi:MAG: hypothetical protein N4A36_01665 [Candidatus Gracilibacteria bacterium]|jgi:hypothetical protein|nr:hypothetical protein [Candidatus Gracilibacteria bacterium]
MKTSTIEASKNTEPQIAEVAISDAPITEIQEETGKGLKLAEGCISEEELNAKIDKLINKFLITGEFERNDTESEVHLVIPGDLREGELSRTYHITINKETGEDHTKEVITRAKNPNIGTPDVEIGDREYAISMDHTLIVKRI